MVNQKDNDSCCNKSSRVLEDYRVEAIVTVDNRGQIVIPKDLREKLGIMTGDKLTVVSSQREGQACCLYLFKTDQLANSVRRILGPMFDEVAKE